MCDEQPPNDPAGTTPSTAGASPAAIASAILDLRESVSARTTDGPTADPPVTATLVSGLRCTFGRDGSEIGETDMHRRLGGSGERPSPGDHLRGAIASCAVTAVAMRAAEMGIEIVGLSATAETRSDGHAFLGIRNGMVGFHDLVVRVDIDAPTASAHEISELMDYSIAHAPVSQSIEHAVPTSVVWTAGEG